MRSHSPSLTLCAWCGRHLRYGQRCPGSVTSDRQALVALLATAALLVGLGLLGAGCGEKARLQTLSVVSGVVHGAVAATGPACDLVLERCIAAKTNPCPALATCHDVRRKAVAANAGFQRLVVTAAIGVVDLNAVMQAAMGIHQILAPLGVDLMALIWRALPALKGANP